MVLGCLAIYDATLGLEVVSTENGRRLEIARTPRELPQANMDLPTNPSLSEWLKADGRVTIVAFIYTKCTSIFSVIGSEFQQMQAAINERGLRNNVRLLSISFDPSDSQLQLAAYASRQKADPAVWQLVGLSSPEETKLVLETFGIVVVPTPLGEFNHNAAFHIVDSKARLAKIVDFEDPARALEEAIAMDKRQRAGS